MNFFTPIQLRVLKTSWIPVLIIWLITAAYLFSKITNFEGLTFIGKAKSQLTESLITLTLPLFVTVVWEMIIKKEWKNAVLMALTLVLTTGLQVILTNFLAINVASDMLYVIGKANALMMFLLIFITRFYISGMGDKLNAALMTALVYFFIPKDGSPLNSLSLARDIPLVSFASPYYKIAIALPVAYCCFICYYVILYLIENIYKWQPFLFLLQSKVKMMTKWEYFFLFLAGFFVYIGAIGVVDTNVYVFFEEGYETPTVAGFMLVNTLAMIFFLYVGAGILRNIVTARALTAGAYSSWILLLHYLPVINIGAVTTLFFLKDKPSTASENADAYLTINRKLTQDIMIGAGILVTVFNIYIMLTAPTGLPLTAIGFLGALYLLKIFAYVRLRASKGWLNLAIGLNVVTILFNFNGHLILSLALLYLYYFVMLELFYPKLELEDTMKVQEPEGDIFTHTA